MFCIISHADVFNTILRGRSPSLDLPAMRELALTTAVIARANCQGEVLVFRPGSYFIVIGFVSPFFSFSPSILQDTDLTKPCGVCEVPGGLVLAVKL